MYEIKFDGYRILARVEGSKIQLLTRNANDRSPELPHLLKALGELSFEVAWLDGEIVVLDENGIREFQALRNAFDSSRSIIFSMCHPTPALI